MPGAADASAFVEAVCSAHARGNIPDRCVRDLVRYEDILRKLRPVEPQQGAPPTDARLVLSDRVGVLVYGAALPEVLGQLRAGDVARPRPTRGWLVLSRDAHGVHERVLAREAGWLLESFREPTPASEAVEDDEDREILAQMWRAGVIVRA